MHSNPDVRWIQRFQNFSRAYTLLREIEDANLDVLKPIEQEGFIQRFEYTFELLWKTLKDYLDESGITLTEATPRVVIKTAFAASILDDGQVFVDMMLARNLLSHTYDFEKFHEILKRVQSEFLPAIENVYMFFLEHT